MSNESDMNKIKEFEYRAALYGQLDESAAGESNESGTAVIEEVQNEDGDTPRLFTQEQVDGIINKRVGEYRNKVEALTKENTESKTNLSNLEELIREAAEEEGIDLDNTDELFDEDDDESSLSKKFRHVDPNAAKMLRIQEKHSKRETDALSKRIEELEATNQEQMEINYINTMATALRDSLKLANVEDEAVGMRYFGDSVFLDEVDNKWYVKDPKDPNKPEMLLAEGVKEYLPEILQKSKISSQGGGAGGSKNRGINVLASKEEEVRLLGEQAKKEPNNTGAVSKYMKSKSELKEMKAQLK